MIHSTDKTFLYAKIGFLAVGATLCAIVLFPEIVGVLDEKWGTNRYASLLIGINLIAVSLLISNRNFRAWIMRSLGYRMLPPLQLLVLIVVRSILAVAGVSITFVILAADWLGIDDTPGYGWMRTMHLFAGLSLLAATFALHNKPFQRWILDNLGDVFHVRLQGFLLVTARLALFTAGLATVVLAALADVVGVDSTPGWGADRTIELFAGISMIAAGYALQNRPMQIWFMRHLGFRMLSPMQIAVLLLIQVSLFIAGLTAVVLVVFADVLGIDPTPGWGSDRVTQLVGALALLVASMVLMNRPLVRWLKRRFG